jgi:hypothetical protein
MAIIDRVSGNEPTTDRGGRRWDRHRVAQVAAAVAGVAALCWAFSVGTTDISATHIANPEAPQPLPEMRWAGLSTHHFWIPLFYAITVGVIAVMIYRFVRHRRDFGNHHPALAIFAVLWLQVLLDPIYNWGFYCVYDPALLHWPITWPPFNFSPSVEPHWILMGAYQVFFIGPAWLILAGYRKVVDRRVTPGSWLDRHPTLSLFLVGAVLGGLADILMEIWMINIGVYKYTQIAGPSLWWGNAHLQVTEIIWVGLLIAGTAVLMRRDDKGRSFATVLAKSNRTLQRLRLGQFGTTFVLVTAALAIYGSFFIGARVAGLATNVVYDRWPYPAIKTFDPDGRLREAGIPGPYYGGTFCVRHTCPDR